MFSIRARRLVEVSSTCASSKVKRFKACVHQTQQTSPDSSFTIVSRLTTQLKSTALWTADDSIDESDASSANSSLTFTSSSSRRCLFYSSSPQQHQQQHELSKTPEQQPPSPPDQHPQEPQITPISTVNILPPDDLFGLDAHEVNRL